MIKNMKELVSDLNDVKFELRENIGIDSSETFGIEIEFEKASLDEVKGSARWVVKPDDSVTVGNMGGELVSPILTDNIDTWKQIKNKCNYLKSKQAVTTSRTAAHIHIGSQILKDDSNNIRKLLKTWELFENIIFYFSCGKDLMPRISIKEFARPIGNDLYLIRKSKNGYNRLNSYYDWYQFLKKNTFNKHSCLNFKNYKGSHLDEKNTVEIRCPNGTLDPIIWQNNINFFVKLLDSTTKNNFDEELIDYYLGRKEMEEYGIFGINMFNIEEAMMLSDIVFDNDLDKMLFLKQYLKMFDDEKTYTKK